MSNELIIDCDMCGDKIAENEYTVLTIRRVMLGSMTESHSKYLCPKCFNKINKVLSVAEFVVNEVGTDD